MVIFRQLENGYEKVFRRCNRIPDVGPVFGSLIGIKKFD